jgi:hypothetical protein
MSKGFFSFFQKASPPVKVPESTQGKKPIDICLNKMSQHIRLDTKYKNLTYGKLLQRSSTILINAGKDDVYIQRLYDQLCRMMLKRRGLTLPVGIDAQNVQRYREICSVVLTIVYLVKVLAHENLNLAIQVEHEGEIYNFSAYQDYLFNRYKMVGMVRNRDNLTITRDVAVSLRLALLNDLLMNADLVSQWFGLFPDMLRLVYRSLQNNDDTVFTIVTDEFINLVVQPVNENLTEPAKRSPEIVANNVAASPAQEPRQAEINPAPVARKPLKPNVLNIGALINKGGGEPEIKSEVTPENVFTENSKTTKHKPTSVNKLQVSPAMAALLNKANSKTSENIDESDGSDGDINYSNVGMDVLRLSLHQTPLPDYVDLVTPDGEIAFSKVLLITQEIWRNNVKKHCSSMKYKEKKPLNEINKALKDQGMMILNERGKEVLSGISESFVGFVVDELPSAIKTEVELLTYDSRCIEISDLKPNKK